MTRRLILLLGGLLSVLFASAQDVRWNGRTDGFWSMGVVDRGLMNPAAAGGLYDTLARGSSRPPRVFILAVFENKTDAVRYRIMPRPEADYSDRLDALRTAQAAGPLPLLQLTAIRDNVVVQSTDGIKSSRAVLRGHDPAIFQAGGRTCELITLGINRLPHSIRADGRNPIIVTADIKADRLPSVSGARSVFRAVQRLTGEQTVNIRIRTDTWFLDGAPMWDPFVIGQPAPSHEQYVANGEVYCWGDDTAVHCSRVRFTDR